MASGPALRLFLMNNRENGFLQSAQLSSQAAFVICQLSEDGRTQLLFQDDSDRTVPDRWTERRTERRAQFCCRAVADKNLHPRRNPKGHGGGGDFHSRQGSAAQNVEDPEKHRYSSADPSVAVACGLRHFVDGFDLVLHPGDRAAQREQIDRCRRNETQPADDQRGCGRGTGQCRKPEDQCRDQQNDACGRHQREENQRNDEVTL